MFNVHEVAKCLSDKLMRPISSVYIDLPYIQDVYLGALMLMNWDKDRYNYIFSRIPEYTKRLKLTHAEYFPDLKVTEEQLLAFMRDPENTKKIMRISPMTSLFPHLPRIHREAMSHTDKCLPVGEEVRIRYLINTYPLSLNKEEREFLRWKFRAMCNDSSLEIGIIEKPLNHLSDSFFEDTQIWFMYDMSPMIDQASPVGNHFAEKWTFRNDLMFAPQRIGNLLILAKLHEMTEKEIREMLIDTALGFNLYTDFFYLDIGLNTSQNKE